MPSSPPHGSPRSRAVLVIAERERPHPRRADGRRVHFEDTADDDAVGEHVEVIIVPFARRPRGRSAFEDQRGHLARLSHIARRPRASRRRWVAVKLGIDSPVAASYLFSAMLLRTRRTPPGFIGPCSRAPPSDRRPVPAGFTRSSTTAFA